MAETLNIHSPKDKLERYLTVEKVGHYEFYWIMYARDSDKETGFNRVARQAGESMSAEGAWRAAKKTVRDMGYNLEAHTDDILQGYYKTVCEIRPDLDEVIRCLERNCANTEFNDMLHILYDIRKRADRLHEKYAIYAPEEEVPQ